MFEELPEPHKRVVCLIGYGKDRATQVSYIAKLTGLGDSTVRSLVAEAVVKYGMPIGTCNEAGRSGLYIISNNEEKNDTVRNLKSRAKKILQRANAISKMPSAEQEKMLL
ncbi:hypothetical protein EVU96_25025 [Bacillus infantis]|uniref:hypothetical protein n=1 Tax=Bacillus infantis TaxID=324767 RepID=UPI00101D976A|nr:hypothetical protein [Bacillus infantis]RYI25079.1 hypothetical protein EVU96_25025 [Bacillus infantis]